MKRLILSLAVLVAWLTISFTASAQGEDALYNRMQYVFDRLDASQLNTNLLYDYGYNLADIGPYDGSPAPDAMADYTTWQTLYASLYTMQFNTLNMVDPGLVGDKIRSSGVAVSQSLPALSRSSPVVVPIMHYEYQKLREDAISGGYVEVINDQIVNLQGNPFLTERVLAASPRRNRLRGNAHTFIFPDSLYFTNLSGALPTLSVDFGNGNGYQAVSWNTPINASYVSVGEKILRIKLTLPDGSSHIALSQVYINSIEPADKNQTATRYLGRPRDQVIIRSEGVQFGANVTVVYSNNVRELRQPLIVAEGFDAWHILNPDDFDSNYTVQDFIGGQNSGGIGFNINIDFFGQQLSDFLEDNNYDLVFVDWEDGTAALEDNAQVLLDVIEFVNEEKALTNSQEENVFMGLSMGGVVGRMAMRLADQANYDPQLRLFISNDVPWQGANVPVTFQLAFKHIAGLSIRVAGFKVELKDWVEPIRNGLEVLNSPAARSLLRYQANGYGDDVSLDDSPPFFNASLGDLQTYPFPNPNETRFIALSNGHECADRQPFAGGASFFEFEGKESIPYIVNLNSILLTPFLRPDYFILGPLTTKNHFKFDFELKALPETGTTRIYRNRVLFDKTILFVIPVTQSLTDVNVDSRPGMLPLDNAPGGLVGIDIAEDDLPEEFLELLPITSFGFVSTVSALSVSETNGDFGGQDALYLRYNPAATLPNGLNTPMDDYITENIDNQPHLLLSLPKGQWLAEELEGRNPGQPCAGRCNWDQSITVPGPVCSGEDITLSVNNPFGFPVTWFIDNNLQLVQRNGDFITVRAPQGITNVSYNVRAEFNAGNCGIYSTPATSLPINDVDQMDVDDALQGSGSLYLNSESTYYVSTVPNVESYEWIVPDGWQVQSLGWKAYITPGTTGPAKVMVKMRTGCNFVTDYIDVCVSGNGYSCGSSEPCGTVVNPCPSPGNPTERSVMSLFYPNPANSLITVNLPDNNDKSSKGTQYRVRIRDTRMKTVLSEKFDTPSFNLDVSALPKGLYTLELWWPGGHQAEQLIIE